MPVPRSGLFLLIKYILKKREGVWILMLNDVIDFSGYKNLCLLLWDRPSKKMSGRAAFNLLDNRLAKYLNPHDLTDDEKTLVDKLAKAYGGGIIDGWSI